MLEAGDFMLVPAMRHVLHESIDAPLRETIEEPAEIEEGRYRIGREDGPADLRMRIGHCRFASPDAELLVPLLPQVVLVQEEPRLAILMQFVDEESRSRRPGRELVLVRLLEVLLIEALRSDGKAVAGPGLAQGLADDRLAIALRAFHAHPEYAWTVAELAAEAAMSRSAFFARFSRTIGVKPMEYVLAWRMALARRLLGDQELGIDTVAQRVGYSSASTFTVAFARYTGVPPARYSRMRLFGQVPLPPHL